MGEANFLPALNWVDVIVIIFLIRGGYIGLSQGLGIELFKSLGAIGVAVLSLLYYDRFGQWLAAHSFLSLPKADLISFLVLFILLLLLFKLLRTLIMKVIQVEVLSGFERWGGCILGLARSLVLASLFLFVLFLIPIPYIQESVSQKSFSGPYLIKVAPIVKDFFLQFKPQANLKGESASALQS